MIRDHFWLTATQFGKLKPLLPTDTRGRPRVDDCRVINGIVHVLKTGTAMLAEPAHILAALGERLVPRDSSYAAVLDEGCGKHGSCWLANTRPRTVPHS